MAKKHNSIDEALKAGNKLHIFRSGGGLRVINMWDRNDVTEGSIYYGECFNLKEALRILGDDIKAGGRKYKEVYGPIEPHYLTGAYWEGTDKGDRWVVLGHTIDAEWCDEFKGHEHMEVTLKGLLDYRRTPKEITGPAEKGETIWWKYTDSEMVYLTEQFIFPGNGEIGASTKTILNPLKEEEVRFPKALVVGEGDTFQSALDDAIIKVEILEEENKNKPYVIMDGADRKAYLQKHKNPEVKV